jgi:hypothetical protein
LPDVYLDEPVAEEDLSPHWRIVVPAVTIGTGA